MQKAKIKEAVLPILSVAMLLPVAHIMALGMERFFELHPQLDESLRVVAVGGVPIIFLVIVAYYAVKCFKAFREGLREEKDEESD